MDKLIKNLAIIFLLALVCAPVAAAEYSYADDGYKLIYETEKVSLPDMEIAEFVYYTDPETGNTKTTLLSFKKRPITFEFYNSTTQQVEGTYTTRLKETVNDDGETSTIQVLSGVKLTRGHNYMVSTLDKEYGAISNPAMAAYDPMPFYLRLDKSGEYPVDIKSPEEYWDCFIISKYGQELEDVSDNKRVDAPAITVYLTEDDVIKSKVAYATFRLVSPLETLFVTSDANGEINVSLLEDTNYMVQLDDPSGRYCMESFPLTVKDHSEDGRPKYIYNHLSCGAVQGFFLMDKKYDHAYDTVLRSLSGNSTVTGLNFLNDKETDTDHYFLNDRKLNKTIDSLSGKDYEVFALETINMYRTEISKLAAGEFKVSRKIPAGKKVEKVYYINRSGALRPLDFKESGGNVEFNMSTMSMYPNVIVYSKTAEQGGNQKAKDGTSVGAGASYKLANAAIIKSKSEEGPAGTEYSKLQLRSSKQTNKSITLKWAKVKGAKKYVVYGNACGKKNRMKKLASTAKTSYNVKKISSKLKKGTYYKFIVVALDKNNRVVSTSKVVHVATKGGKSGNYKSVSVKKTVVNKAKKLKKGNTLKLNAKAVAASKKLKVKKHRVLSYESSNTKIATVSKKGVVKGKKRGTCYIFAYAQDGVFKRIKVNVR